MSKGVNFGWSWRYIISDQWTSSELSLSSPSGEQVSRGTSFPSPVLTTRDRSRLRSGCSLGTAEHFRRTFSKKLSSWRSLMSKIPRSFPWRSFPGCLNIIPTEYSRNISFIKPRYRGRRLSWRGFSAPLEPWKPVRNTPAVTGDVFGLNGPPYLLELRRLRRKRNRL